MKLPDDIPTELAFQNSIPVLPPASPDEERWKQNAACRGMTDQFLQPRDDGTKRAVCMSCSAFGECRALVDLIEMHALGSNGYQAGFWAGETPIERRRRRGRYTNVHDTRKAA